MYYESRAQAGKELAAMLIDQYSQKNTAVIALSEGGLLTAVEIAKKLHSSVGLLLTQDIKVPGESVAVGAIDELGTFTYNRMYSPGQLEAFDQEYLNIIEQEKMQKLHAINRMVGKGGFLRPELLNEHVIVVVADGADSGLAFDVALNFLKPIPSQRVIVAVPVASISAIDRLHVLFDEMYVLSVKEHYYDTNHYYEDNELPDRSLITETIEQIALHWDYPPDPNPLPNNSLKPILNTK